MKRKLTNVRTFLQFSRGEEVVQIEFRGNKLMAMFSIKSGYGVKSFSVIREYKSDGLLIEGTHSELT